MKRKVTAKETILRKVRDASHKPYERNTLHVDWDKNVFVVPEENPLVVFAENLVKAGGKFVYCKNENDFKLKLLALLDERNWINPAVHSPGIGQILEELNVIYTSSIPVPIDTKVGIGGCDFLIARLGSVIVSSWSSPGRQIHSYPEIHIVVAKASQVVNDTGIALKELRKKYSVDFPSQVTIITGPSRTADIEKTLVMGAHGPKELIVFLILDV